MTSICPKCGKEQRFWEIVDYPTIPLKSGFTCDGDDLYNGVCLCSVFGERCRIQTDRDGYAHIAAKVNWGIPTLKDGASIALLLGAFLRFIL